MAVVRLDRIATLLSRQFDFISKNEGGILACLLSSSLSTRCVLGYCYRAATAGISQSRYADSKRCLHLRK